MAPLQHHHPMTRVEGPRYPEPVASARRRSRVSCDSSRHSRTSGFSWFRLSADGRPWGPVDELNLYMGTAFSSIPDDDESTHSPKLSPWSTTNRSALSDKEAQYAVDWNKPHDPENPMNWTTSSRWVQIVLVSILTLQAAIASSMPAPTVPEILKEFKAPEGVLYSLVVSIFNLGFVLGPVLAAPMSELYGRYPAYTISNVLFLACNAACAASPNLGVLLVFRFLSGCAGAAPLSVGGGTITDVAPLALRGRAVSVYSLALLLGPTIGPAAGGFLTEYLGWRWVFWTMCIMASRIRFNAAILGFALLLFLRETSAKSLLERRAMRLRKRTGDPGYISALHDGVSSGEAFARAVKRPLRLLVNHSIVLALSAYSAVVYGYLHLLLTTLPTVFAGKYGFSAGFSGLMFLGASVGTVAATLLVSLWGDRIAASRFLKEGIRSPEFRLLLMAYSVPLVPAGLLLYGWTAQKTVFWLVPVIGIFVVGMGTTFVFTPLTNYLVDAFTTDAASALAASTIFRGMSGAVLPLAGPPMYAALGLGWANTILAAFTIVMAPTPWVIMKKGQAMREKHAHRIC